MLEERTKLEQIVEQIQKQNDVERQQQLERFLSEREQLQLDIAYLKVFFFNFLRFYLKWVFGYLCDF